LEHLIAKPSLILENLIILYQTDLVAKVLEQLPSLVNDDLFMEYGQKALDVSKKLSQIQ